MIPHDLAYIPIILTEFCSHRISTDLPQIFQKIDSFLRICGEPILLSLCALILILIALAIIV